MKKIAFLAAAMFAITANSAFALSLTVENKTGKELHELYFAPSGQDEWGDDHLGDKTVANEETFTLSKIPAGHYDVLFVDEKGAKCDIRDVHFTESETFVMTKEIIKGCQKATEAEEKEDDKE